MRSWEGLVQKVITMSSTTPITVPAQAIDTLEIQLAGRVVRPADADYDAVRAVWNGMIDRRPAFVVRCAKTADVVAAVNFARDQRVPFSVRGGGHNVSGSAVIDGGMVIDLSEMRNVLVNPRDKSIRVEGGATWADVDQMTQRYGLAVPGGVVSETGIAGLTLGGGVGWLRNKYGLTIDNLLSVEVVTADGQVLTANASEHSELFWALRGGGGAFGVVTTFEYRLRDVGPDVMFALVMYSGDEAQHVMETFRDYVADAPDEVSALASLGYFPADAAFPEDAHGKPAAIILACYAGDPSDGTRVLQPLREISTPVVDFSGTMPFVEVQTVFDEDYPAGEMRYYWKSTYLDALSDDAIAVCIQQARMTPSSLSTIDFWHMGGAIQRVPEDATAYRHRAANFLIGIESNWVDAANDQANIDWTRQAFDALVPFSRGRQYMNFPGFWEGNATATQAMVGTNYRRLSDVKSRYDPDNLFSFGTFIHPHV